MTDRERRHGMPLRDKLRKIEKLAARLEGELGELRNMAFYLWDLADEVLEQDERDAPGLGTAGRGGAVE